MIGIIIVGILVFVILSLTIGIYNKGIGLRNYIFEAFSTMDVYLKKRWDLIPNLLETTKGYMAHEKGIFEQVAKIRSQGYNALSNEQKIDLNNQLGMYLSKLIAVAENYPDLKANESFNNLSKELSKIEEDIANSRKYYNGCVREYNTFIQIFPNNIFSGMFNFQKEKLFEINENERNVVKVSF